MVGWPTLLIEAISNSITAPVLIFPRHEYEIVNVIGLNLVNQNIKV